jgi:hypothetical protein
VLGLDTAVPPGGGATGIGEGGVGDELVREGRKKMKRYDGTQQYYEIWWEGKIGK